jgi:hypothetical protein
MCTYSDSHQDFYILHVTYHIFWKLSIKHYWFHFWETFKNVSNIFCTLCKPLALCLYKINYSETLSFIKVQKILMVMKQILVNDLYFKQYLSYMYVKDFIYSHIEFFCYVLCRTKVMRRLSNFTGGRISGMNGHLKRTIKVI